MSSIQTLPGFRDYYPAQCALRRYILETWGRVARQYGFAEYDGPVIESADLYRKKSGEELMGQLFSFEDRGGREVALRPELTPTLGRMLIAKQRDYKKPIKWFSAGPFFRYEKPQKGRYREFFQFNSDIIGAEGAPADGELIALSIDLMRAFGFTKKDFSVRMSDRRLWNHFFEEQNLPPSEQSTFLNIIDKMGRTPEEKTATALQNINLSLDATRAFMQRPAEDFPALQETLRNLQQRGLSDYLTIDLSIVRGLAYYTGTVFEVFDAQQSHRAIAGGGRYDQLLSLLSNGKVDLPAVGFGMGDAVLGDLIQERDASRALYESWSGRGIDIYLALAEEKNRPAFLSLLQRLRTAGKSVDYPFSPMKLNKQFQMAESLRARHILIIDDQYPSLRIKDMQTREDTRLPVEDFFLKKSS